MAPSSQPVNVDCVISDVCVDLLVSGGSLLGETPHTPSPLCQWSCLVSVLLLLLLALPEDLYQSL